MKHVKLVLNEINKYVLSLDKDYTIEHLEHIKELIWNAWEVVALDIYEKEK